MPTRASPWLACSLLAVSSISVAAEPKPSVVVVVHGAEPLGRAARDGLAGQADLPVEVRLASLPNLPGQPPVHSGNETLLAEARRRYVEAEFSECLAKLSDDEAVPRALERGRRVEAARILLWRVACNVGMGRPQAAARSARALGVMGLEVPGDVATTSPEVETAIARALKEVAAAPRLPLHVKGNVPGARVSIDGRPPACVLPCVVPLPEGEHIVRVDADGMNPVTRSVHLRPPTVEVLVEMSDAPPDVAAEQWTARYADGDAIDSPPSIRLLSVALRAPRLALITVDTEGEGARLRGTVGLDGDVAARSERLASRPGDMQGVTTGLLSDLLVRGKVVEPSPPLYARPLFWAAVGGAAVGAAVLTSFLVRPTTVRAEVRF